MKGVMPQPSASATPSAVTGGTSSPRESVTSPGSRPHGVTPGQYMRANDAVTRSPAGRVSSSSGCWTAALLAAVLLAVEAVIVAGSWRGLTGLAYLIGRQRGGRVGCAGHPRRRVASRGTRRITRRAGRGSFRSLPGSPVRVHRRVGDRELLARARHRRPASGAVPGRHECRSRGRVRAGAAADPARGPAPCRDCDRPPAPVRRGALGALSRAGVCAWSLAVRDGHTSPRAALDAVLDLRERSRAGAPEGGGDACVTAGCDRPGIAASGAPPVRSVFGHVTGDGASPVCPPQRRRAPQRRQGRRPKADSEAAALAVLSARPGISGADLGRAIGVSPRTGQRLLAALGSRTAGEAETGT